jgi:hypothetical protein
MRTNLWSTVVAVLLISFPVFAQNSTESKSDLVSFGQKTAIAAVNFRQGDAAGFNSARDNFTAEGWKDFLKRMEGYLDEKGAPTFTSSFVATRDATVLDEKEGVLHLRIPGTLTQSNKFARTTYKAAAIEVHVLRTPVKIQRLEQIMCMGTSTACQ